jgi:putative endonuclease
MVTVYVLRGKTTGKCYVGITSNMVRRLAEHRRRDTKGGQIIGGCEVMHTEQYPDYGSARLREKFLKSGQGREWLQGNLRKSRPATGG